jgi:hypothetical protein
LIARKNTMHIADNQDALLDYLYEEGDAAERLKIAAHLQQCAACSVAVLELQSVRGMLRGWHPPASASGLRIVQEESPAAVVPVAASGRGGRWAQAAAALLLFVAGMAASQLRVDYTDGAITVRRNSAQSAIDMRAVSITLPADSSASSVGTSATVTPSPTLAALESDPGDRPKAAEGTAVETERLLQRVRAMIDESEQRQQRELALRVSQVAREVDTQHQADLLRMQQNFGQQQELMDYLVRTSGGAK